MEDIKVFKFFPAEFMVQFLAIKWLGLGGTILVTTFYLLEKLTITEHPAVPFLKAEGVEFGCMTAAGPIILCFTLYPLLCYPNLILFIINGLFGLSMAGVGYFMFDKTLKYQPYYFLSIMFFILAPLTAATMIWLAIFYRKKKDVPADQIVPPVDGQGGTPADQSTTQGGTTTTSGASTPATASGASTPATASGASTPATASGASTPATASGASTPATTSGASTPAKSTEATPEPVKSAEASKTK